MEEEEEEEEVGEGDGLSPVVGLGEVARCTTLSRSSSNLVQRPERRSSKARLRTRSVQPAAEREWRRDVCSSSSLVVVQSLVAGLELMGFESVDGMAEAFADPWGG
ncbi:hypothetical protein CISG_06863 [Coccidioides immitis RMSCC 3703]|uniref:Uncharacterized protein n=1 Tax=Coccidioides immitis RMSCC 3703 TaxID=454286 RepID=A0A0J8R2N1_COCIT|nr:hypothetical protein CISG_06863 [Coccidioides immitis RMSCC 3703]